MAQTTHTPGPWKKGFALDHRNALSVFDDRAQEGKPKSEFRCICLVTFPENADEQDEANAALIAASPDLLAALSACLPYMEGLESDNCNDPSVGLYQDRELTEAYELAKAAIAKATNTELSK